MARGSGRFSSRIAIGYCRPDVVVVVVVGHGLRGNILLAYHQEYTRPHRGVFLESKGKEYEVARSIDV
jgi:hypothetical protein